MKNRKKLVIKDERTEKLDGNISGEILLGMYLFLALEIFAKVIFFNLTLLSYLPELLFIDWSRFVCHYSPHVCRN